MGKCFVTVFIGTGLHKSAFLLVMGLGFFFFVVVFVCCKEVF